MGLFSKKKKTVTAEETVTTTTKNITMKLKSILLTVIALVSISSFSFAQPQGNQSYNFTRALEEIRNGNNAAAMDYLTTELRENPNNGYAHMTMAILKADDENYHDAMTSINLAIRKLPKSDKDYTGRAYASRANLYAIAGDTLAALADFDKAVRINPDNEDIQEDFGQLLYELKRYDEADNAYRRIISINPGSVMGYMGLGRDAYATGNYEEAIRQYDNVLRMYDNYSSGYAFRAESYLKVGRYLEAINDITKSLSIDGDKKAFHCLFKFPDDKTNLVVAKLKGMAARNPHEPEWWYYIGLLYSDKNMYSEALEALGKAYDIDAHPVFLEMIAECYQELGDYPYAHLGKGDMLMLKGQTEEAMEAYRKVVELDTVPNNGSCAMYALLALGEKEQAISFMNRVIENDSTHSGNYYDAACFYSRLGDMDKALQNLRTAFEKGFRRLHHVMADDDLELLRTTEGFNTLMEEFRNEPDTSTDNESVSTPEIERVEIPFTPDGGCASVRCTINELPLNFIFDTGASTVSISQVEANFMLKNGYLRQEDFVGSSRFVDANGDITEGTIVNLRDVDFGGLKLNNVRASVVRNQRAPLLLGQSVLGRLGPIEIDNPGKKLIITHSK